MTRIMTKMTTSFLLELKAFLFQNGIHNLTPYQSLLIYQMGNYPLYLRREDDEDDGAPLSQRRIDQLLQLGCAIKLKQKDAVICQLTPLGEVVYEKIALFFAQKTSRTVCRS